MVVLSESYLQHIEYQFLQTALTHHIALKIFRRYADDSHTGQQKNKRTLKNF